MTAVPSPGSTGTAMATSISGSPTGVLPDCGSSRITSPDPQTRPGSRSACREAPAIEMPSARCSSSLLLAASKPASCEPGRDFKASLQSGSISGWVPFPGGRRVSSPSTGPGAESKPSRASSRAITITLNRDRPRGRTPLPRRISLQDHSPPQRQQSKLASFSPSGFPLQFSDTSTSPVRCRNTIPATPVEGPP